MAGREDEAAANPLIPAPTTRRIMALFGRHVRGREMLTPARECTGDFARSRMLAAGRNAGG